MSDVESPSWARSLSSCARDGEVSSGTGNLGVGGHPGMLLIVSLDLDLYLSYLSSVL